MSSLAVLKTEQDGFKVEYEIMTPFDLAATANPYQAEIAKKLESVDARLEFCEQKVAELNREIDRLTNHADGLDYTIAVASGILTGLIDSFFVGETEINIDKIRKELEEKYKTPNDRAYEHKGKDGKWTSSPMFHRLEDLAHHPTPLGLVAAILVRFFRLGIFIKDGKVHIFPLNAGEYVDDPEKKKEAVIKDIKDLAMVWGSVALTGVCCWLATIAEEKYEEKYSTEMPEPLRKLVKLISATPLIIEVLKTADTWLGHIMSDVSTSAGIPGIFLSILQEISCLPILRNTPLPQFVKDSYRIFEETHMSKYAGVVFTAVKKQSIPVIINECLVRGFYFIRHLISEIKNSQSFDKVDWNQVIPFGNRTIERMMTIASGTFMAVDIADAAIRSGGFNPAVLLRVNFVGVGRFAIALATDIGMGIKRNKLQKEKYVIIGQQLDLLNVKISYLYSAAEYGISEALEEQSLLWITAGDTLSTIMEAEEYTIQAVIFCKEVIELNRDAVIRMSEYVDAIDRENPGYKEEIIEKIKWGVKNEK